MQYSSFSAFLSAIGQSFRSAISRCPLAVAWILFLVGGLFLYAALSGPTPLVLFGRNTDGVVVSIRIIPGHRQAQRPTVFYALPEGKALSFETTALLGRTFHMHEKLQVRYLPWWPQQVAIFSFGQLFSPLLIEWAGACLFLAGGVGLVRARRPQIVAGLHGT